METSQLEKSIFDAVLNIESEKRSIRKGSSSHNSSPRISINSRKSLHLNLDHFSNENSQYSVSSNTARSNYRQEESHKPISLVIIEKYFSEICQSIANKGTIDTNLLIKADTMQEVLKNCLVSVPDLSLQYYVLMESSLKEIQEIYSTQDEDLYSALLKKLVQLAELIEDNKFTSATERANTQPPEEIIEITGLNEIGRELEIRISKVTVRILNLWKKILSPQREASIISCGFLLLYFEVDTELKIPSNGKIPLDKAVVIMKNYLANPGTVVNSIRKTKEFIDKEMISVGSVRKIHDLFSKITAEHVKNIDKTMTGFTIYELVLFAINYYYAYAKEHYSFNVFEKQIHENFETEPTVSNNKEKVVEIQTKNEEMIKNNFEDIPTNEKYNYENNEKVIEEPIMIRRKVKNEDNIRKSLDFTEIEEKKDLLADKLHGNKADISLKLDFSSIKPILSPSKSKISTTNSLKLSQTQKNLQSLSTSPKKLFSPALNKNPSKYISQSPPKPLEKKVACTKKVVTPAEQPLKISKNPTIRARKSRENAKSLSNHNDILEEMQYKQYIEEKFRHFLIDKLKKETEKMLKNGLDKHDIKIVNELKASKCKNQWIEEFEKANGVVKFNVTKSLSDDKKYTSECLKAQKQLDILERYNSEIYDIS